MGNANTPDLSEMIGRIMENPELVGLMKGLTGDEGGATEKSDVMSRLPEIMSALSPMISGQGKPEEGNKLTSSRDTARVKSGEKYDKARAARLMSALKPYLSRERCEMIDKCMTVLQLGDVMTVLRSLDGRSDS